MAHVRLDVLTSFIPSELDVDGTGSKLRECTPAQDAEPAYYSVEDIIKITNQPEYMADPGSSIKKFMATFWGHTYQVWAGIDSNGRVIEGIIALRCPPFYSPHAFPGDDVSEEKGTPPIGFPTQATLPTPIV